jgi:transketolase
MRNAFAKAIMELAQQDERLVLLSADIGNRLFDDFKTKCPNRFFNCGVAEANMIGVAAGLTMSGLRAVCYTIAPFITYRCLEQIRIDLCYHEVPVTIVGAGSGLAYASLGATHHSCEELGMLRLLPGLTVLAPGDAWEVRAGLKAALQHPGPVYMRIGKKGEPVVHSSEPDFVIGKAIPLREGTDVCLLSTGAILSTALSAADLLASAGCTAAVFSVPTVKPLDLPLLTDVFSRFRLVATIEEHSVLGGLGGSVAEWRSSAPDGRACLLRFGTADELLHETCNQTEAREYFGLTPSAIADRILGGEAARSDS